MTKDDVVYVDISHLAPPPPGYSEGWTKGFERGQTLGLRRVRVERVWQIFGALACVVNASVAAWYQGAGAYGNEDWPQICKDWNPDIDTVQK